MYSTKIFHDTPKVGILAGNFDVIHPGYILMFQDAKYICDKLVVALHVDPTIERPTKMKPILSAKERAEILLALRFVDEVAFYNTEDDLVKVLERVNPDIRILGSDYKGKKFTGDHLDIEIHYHDRSHDWSTTRFKNEIAEQVIKQRNDNNE